MGRSKNTKKYDRHQTHRRKKRKGNGIAVFLVLTLMCLSVFFALSLTVLFKTESITVKGNSVYTNEQIIAASGMELGKNMFVSVFNGAENAIVTQLPYIKEAKINRSLDGMVEINVKPATAAFSYEVTDGYLLVADDGKALEKATEPVMDKPVIHGAEPADIQLGKTVSFTDDRVWQILSTVFSAAKDNGINITEISTDATASFVDITIEDRIIAKIGNGEDAAYKLLHIKESMAQLAADESGVFTFSSDNSRRAYFRSVDIHADETVDDTLPEADETENGGEEDSDNIADENDDTESKNGSNDSE